MHKLVLPFLFFLAACAGKKDDQKPAQDENKDYLISLDGIGAIKNSMSQEEVEKLLQQKVPLTNPTDTVSGSWTDSATIRYKGAELRLEFVRTYAYMKEDSFHMRVTRITTSSPLCRSAGGIGIGASKQEIVDGFDNFLLYMEPGFDHETDTLRSKTLYSIKVRESREGPQLIFYLKDNKVYSIEVGSFYDDSE